ncbi:hypothetical protein V8G54_024747 [Vigna mungo]|uniref:Uncharacterized protein n=1 Tax=Vigna mungo TaxID=3915 RepID=A0AAQ3N7C6_VIGMU
MSEFGENWCEEISKVFEANSTVLDRWSVDVKCQEELYNLQSESLFQQNLFDYPPTQHNANMSNVESVLIPLPKNLSNTQIGENWCEEISKAFEANSTVLDRWSVDVKCQEEPYNLQSESLPQQNLLDYPPT